MKQLSHPLWSLLTATLPISLLLWLQFTVFHRIETELTPDSVSLWWWLHGILAVMALGHTALALVQAVRKQPLPHWGIYLFFFGYLVWLFFYLDEASNLIPWGIPNWLLPGDREIYAGSFVMPSIIHLVVQSVVAFTPNRGVKVSDGAWLQMFGVPAAFYILFVVLVPLLSSTSFDFFALAFLAGVTLGAFGILFLAAWMLYQRIINGRTTGHNIILGRYLVLGIVIPAVGFWIHEGLDNPLGDFTDLWFLVLAVMHGLLLLWPTEGDRRIVLSGLFLRSVLFPFILYFLLVFAPYLPIGFIALLFLGIGFFVMLPMVLTFYHWQQWVENFQVACQQWGKGKSLALVLVGLMVLPLGISFKYSLDRRALHNALEYLYEAPLDAPTPPHVNPQALDRVLDVLADQTGRRFGGGLFNGGNNSTPLLSWYYRWWVLDNLSLSTEKQDKLRGLFLPDSEEAGTWRQGRRMPDPRARLTSTKVRAHYDEEIGAWRSWVDLKIYNPSPNGQTEFQTAFTLPPGAYISNYYLDMPGGEREYGLLTEKKAALWVYRNIVSRRRDPGLVYYQQGREIGLRVFPVELHGRSTGFEVVHTEPLTLTLNGKKLRLGNDGERASPHRPIIAADGRTTYVPKEVTAGLSAVQRKPYLHFILPGGAGDAKNLGGYLEQARRLRSRLPEGMTAEVRVSLAGAYVTEWESMEAASEGAKMHPWEGGHFVERALDRMAFGEISVPDDHYPIPVVLGMPALANSFEEVPLWAYLPEQPPILFVEESDSVVVRNVNGVAREQKVVMEDLDWSPQTVYAYPLVEHPTHYLASNTEPAVLVYPDRAYPTTIPESATHSAFEAGMLLEAQQLHRLLYPDQAQARWQDVVRTSFEYGVLAPATAYMVVETEAQKQALLAKQEQILNSEHYMDAGTEELQPMPEPELWLLLLGFGLWWYWKYRRS